MTEQYIFRQIQTGEYRVVSEIEQICFPPNEACRPEIMKQRVELYPENFTVCVEVTSGNIVGFINGLVTSENHLKDEFFTDPCLNESKGLHMMILGVDVLPEYRKQGIARKMMEAFLREETEKGRKAAVLTCLKEKVAMYASFGFRDLGLCSSEWGGEEWHEMIRILSP